MIHLLAIIPIIYENAKSNIIYNNYYVPRHKMPINNDLFYMPNVMPFYCYDRLFALLDRLRITHENFAALAGISIPTLQRLRHITCNATHSIDCKILTALNKLEPGIKHTFNDIYETLYK